MMCTMLLLCVYMHLLSTARLIFPPALWLLSTKCILTIHSYNSAYCTLPPPSQCVCVWCTGCGCRKPREGGDGSSTGANCGPDTHTAVHIYIWVSVCVCVWGGWTTIKYFIAYVIERLLQRGREWQGERGGVSVFDICISTTSGITCLTSERSLIQYQEETQTPV